MAEYGDDGRNGEGYDGRYEDAYPQGGGYEDAYPPQNPRESDSPYDAFEDVERRQQSSRENDPSNRRRSGREERTREGREDRTRERDPGGGRESRDRGRESHRESRDRHRSRDVEMSRSRDIERHRSSRSRDLDDRHHRDEYERRHRHRRSRSRSESRHHHHRRSSRSRSRSRSKSKRQSGFDMVPPGIQLPNAQVQIPGQPLQAMPNMPNMQPAYNTMMSMGMGMPMMNVQAITQQATRHARRVYVGGLPPMANEQTIASFFNQVMAAIGGNTAGPGDAVVNVYINHEKKFAFVEMRTVEEASNAMALDGIVFEGVSVRVRRPTDYNPSLAATLGPSQPSPNLNLSAVGLTPGAIGSAVGPDRVFVGGLPYYLTEPQVKELLESFGPLRGFDFVRDRETGNSKGYAFCVYQDPNVTDIACAGLNGLKMGDKTLTVRRATMTGQTKPEQENVILQVQQQIALQKMALTGSLIPGSTSPMENPTKVLCLTEVVSPDELKDDEEYQDIVEDIREECAKYGNIANLHIPRPQPDGSMPPGVGKVFVEYMDTEGSMKAKQAIHGRKFGGNTVVAIFYAEDKFANNHFE